MTPDRRRSAARPACWSARRRSRDPRGDPVGDELAVAAGSARSRRQRAAELPVTRRRRDGAGRRSARASRLRRRDRRADGPAGRRPSSGVATGSRSRRRLAVRPGPRGRRSAGGSSSRARRAGRSRGSPRGRGASGRRRATTMWSAPVAAASSSTMAPRIASGDTDRDRLDRIRAKDSASSRRDTCCAATASRWRIAAAPTTNDEADRPPSPSVARRRSRRAGRRSGRG